MPTQVIVLKNGKEKPIKTARSTKDGGMKVTYPDGTTEVLAKDDWKSIEIKG